MVPPDLRSNGLQQPRRLVTDGRTVCPTDVQSARGANARERSRVATAAAIRDLPPPSSSPATSHLRLSHVLVTACIRIIDSYSRRPAPTPSRFENRLLLIYLYVYMAFIDCFVMAPTERPTDKREDERTNTIGKPNATSQRPRTHGTGGGGRGRPHASARAQRTIALHLRRRRRSPAPTSESRRAVDVPNRPRDAVRHRGARWMYPPTLRQTWSRQRPRPQYAFKKSMLNVSCNSH